MGRGSAPFWLVVVWCVAGCDRGAQPPKVEPPAVVIASPVERQVTDYAEYTGRTEAPYQQDVRARVSGYVIEAPFKEGSEVKKGDVLYVIDARPFQAALDVAQGQLELAKARAERAANDLRRAEEQRKRPGVISEQEFDQFRAARLEADASVKAAEAQVTSKRLDVEYSKVQAEQDGRVGRVFFTVGNLVSADNLLTTVVSQDPMYVYYDVDERTLLHIQELIRAGKFRSARRHDDVPVLVGLANEQGRFPHAGRVNFVDNKVNPSTGTLKVRAVLPNPEVANRDRVFSSGLFVRVRLPLGEPRKAVLISDRCVGTDQGQKFVYVVNDQNQVAKREVTLGQLHDGLRVVETGLTGSERVIVSGLQKVRPDQIVAPQPGEMSLKR